MLSKKENILRSEFANIQLLLILAKSVYVFYLAYKLDVL